MVRTLKLRLILGVLLATVALISAACGGDKDPEQVALDVAKDWSTGAIDSVAGEIGAAVTGNIPLLSGLAGSAVREQLEEGIRWTFSSPTRSAEDRYVIRATASSTVTINIPFLPDQVFDVRASFDLDVDTGAKRVVRSTLDLSSLSASRR